MYTNRLVYCQDVNFILSPPFTVCSVIAILMQISNAGTLFRFLSNLMVNDLEMTLNRIC